MKEGDIVLYDDPNESDPRYRNLLTQVLDPIGRWHANAIIRFWGTTMVVPKAYLQVIEVSKFPIQVPEIPSGKIQEGRLNGKARRILLGEKIPPGWICATPGNDAGFSSIPLAWFDYKFDPEYEPDPEPATATV